MLGALVAGAATFSFQAAPKTHSNPRRLQLHMSAEFDYENIVASKLPFMSRSEAATYLDAHSTRYMLAKVGVGDEVIEEARAIILDGADAVADDHWDLVRIGVLKPPPGWTPPKKSVTSWFDSGRRLVASTSFTPGEPSGWGIVPYVTLQAEEAALTASLEAAQKEVTRLLLLSIGERARLAQVSSALVPMRAQKKAAAAAAAVVAAASVPELVVPPPKEEEEGNNAGLFGALAAAAAAAAGVYLQQSGVQVDPSAIVAAGTAAGLA